MAEDGVISRCPPPSPFDPATSLNEIRQRTRVRYFLAAQGFPFGAHGFPFAAHGLAAFLAFGPHGLDDFVLGAQGFAPWAAAGTGVDAIMPPTAAIDPRVCSVFFSVGMRFLLGLKIDGRHRRVVTFTSHSGMAFVREVSTTLSRPVSTKSPMPKKAAPMSGLPMRETRAIQSRRTMIAWREP